MKKIKISECLVNAYKNGQFSQIPKLTNFEGQFEKSVFLIGADVMNRFLSSCFVIENSQVLIDSLCGDMEIIGNSYLNNYIFYDFNFF